MRFLFLTIKPATCLAQDYRHNEFYAAMLESFPGSVIYGPGYVYETNDVLEIMEEHGGRRSFDAIWCELPERVLLGEQFGENIISHYSIPSRLWKFPVNLDRADLPKMLYINDFWHVLAKEWAEIFLTHSIDYAFSGILHPLGSQSAFQHFFPLGLRENAVFIPLGGVIPSICVDLGLQRTHDVLLSGAQLPSFYPVRFQMWQAFNQSDLSVLSPRHPGYNFHNASVSETHPYVRALNLSRISAFCSTRFHFAPLKLLEAMACGCAALCDRMEGIGLMGFRPDENFILADGGNCVEKAAAWLKNPGRLREMTEKSRKIVLQRHSIKTRVSELAELIPPLLNGEKATHWAQHSPNLKLVRARRRTVSLVKRPVERQHILEMGLSVSKKNWDLWYKLCGMNSPTEEETSLSRTPALLSARHLLFNHMALFKAEYLLTLADRLGATSMLEKDGEAGFYSLTWAQWLYDQGTKGRVLLLDPIGHEDKHSSLTPFYMEWATSRRSLWEAYPFSEKARFLKIEDDFQWPKSLQKIDLALLHNQETVYQDACGLLPHLKKNGALVVDGYGPANPGALFAVRQLATENEMSVTYVDCSPYQAGLAVCRLPPQETA